MGLFFGTPFIANDAGVFDSEISPIDVKVGRKTISFSTDEHPRPETTLEQLAKLPTVFKKDGAVTAGLCINDLYVGSVCREGTPFTLPLISTDISNQSR